MTAPTPDATALAIALDRTDRLPLSVQLYWAIRDLILTGRLDPGHRLPSTRSLALELGVSRTTTVTAFDQLAAEGFLEGRRGSGAFVAEMPQGLLRGTSPEPELDPAGGSAEPPAVIGAAKSGPPGRPFNLGAPDVAAFPVRSWSRGLAKSWRRPEADLYFGAPGGFQPLRRAIADHLKIVRGVPCDWHQVIVTASTAESIELVARGLLGVGDRAWIEDPGYRKAGMALEMAGLRAVPVAVDADGLDVEAAKRAVPDARLAVVTPSRQFPLGMTMTLARRLALLDWAKSVDGYVIEDDYDSEFRYAGRPIAPLAGLDRSGRVVYLGSFTKVMFRALRLGYLVAPPVAADRLLSVQRRYGGQASMVAQPALADFIARGEFAAHIRRMRRLYAARQKTLLAALRSRLGGLLQVEPQDFGMHLVAAFIGRLGDANDTEIARRCGAAGIDVSALSSFYRGKTTRNGLLLGYAGWPENELEAAAEKLAGILTETAGPLGPGMTNRRTAPASRLTGRN